MVNLLNTYTTQQYKPVSYTNNVTMFIQKTLIKMFTIIDVGNSNNISAAMFQTINRSIVLFIMTWLVVVLTACLIFLIIPVPVSQAKTSFSKLKTLFENYLTNAVLNIKTSQANELDIEKIIYNFSNAQTRKFFYTS